MERIQAGNMHTPQGWYRSSCYADGVSLCLLNERKTGSAVDTSRSPRASLCRDTMSISSK